MRLEIEMKKQEMDSNIQNKVKELVQQELQRQNMNTIAATVVENNSAIEATVIAEIIPTNEKN